MASRLYYSRSDSAGDSPVSPLLSARTWFLLRTFPLFMWLSELFHRWLLHDQVGDDDA